MSDFRKAMLEVLARASETAGAQEGRNDLLREALTPNSRGIAESLETIARQLDLLRGVGQAQVDAVGANTDAVIQNTRLRGSGAGSTAVEAVKTASRFLGGGLTFLPMLSGLANLFGGSKPESASPLTPYAAPRAQQLEWVWAGGSRQAPAPADYGQDGLPRAAATTTYAPQVIVQVQAMDSRSFLDHSTEIARAVRDAMLNSHPLNDVFNEM